MMTIAALALTLQAAISPASAQPHPIGLEQGMAMFERLCIAGFPDPARAEAARADPVLGLVLVPIPPDARRAYGGGEWVSEQIKLSYVDAKWLPRDLPSPQCSIEFTVAEARNHRALADQVAVQLTLPGGKLGKDRPNGFSQWDKKQADGTTHRLFLETQATATNTRVTLRLLNLRD